MRSARKLKNKTGKGFLNSAINSLPFEAHIPGYQFCGPGTKLKARLAAGEKGINLLDNACRNHDIAYENNADLISRHKADKELENRAWERVKAKDSSFKEKAAAYAVVNTMKAKQKLGMGCSIKKKNKKKIRKQKNSSKNKKRLIQCSRHIGGALPLIPIFAGLSALGSLASGASSVYNAVKNGKKKGGGLYLKLPTGKGLYLNKKGEGVRSRKVYKKKN